MVTKLERSTRRLDRIAMIQRAVRDKKDQGEKPRLTQDQERLLEDCRT